MLTSVIEILLKAQLDRYAVGAFNVYNLEGVRAVVLAAEKEHSPVILQVHPKAVEIGGWVLVDLCLAAAKTARVPVGVHLDHSTSAVDIRVALKLGVPSFMADGSHLPYRENVDFSRKMANLAHTANAAIEVELGRLSGTEDGLSVPERNARLTDPNQAADFVQRTGADCLAVCIGNVHGKYVGEPNLDMERLSAIRNAVDVPLVLHGASGLPTEMIRRAIARGVCKFNVNTELREVFVATFSKRVGLGKQLELPDMMKQTIDAMQHVVCAKIQTFDSSNRS